MAADVYVISTLMRKSIFKGLAISHDNMVSGGIATGNDVPGMASNSIHDLKTQHEQEQEHERESDVCETTRSSKATRVEHIATTRMRGKRGDASRDASGEMATARIKGTKIEYGIPPDELKRLMGDFGETYDELPTGKQGVPSDKSKALFQKLPKAPFEQWCRDMTTFDEMRDDDDDSMLEDYDVVNNRLVERYIKLLTAPPGAPRMA